MRSPLLLREVCVLCWIWLIILLGCRGAPTDATDADADGYTLQQGDCDDAEALVHPMADEACNGVDDDCDHEVDEAGGEGLVDADGDGWGDPLRPSATCDAVPGVDCDDAVDTTWPGATEIPDDGVDQDCDGFDSLTCRVDGDQDGVGGDVTVVVTTGACEDGATTTGGDCDDEARAVYPGAAEILDDGVDQDCDGVDSITCWLDADGDGWGTTPVGGDAACTGHARSGGDCAGGDPAIHPGVVDVPDDGVDQDCDGAGATSCWQDADGDGYGSTVLLRVDPAGRCGQPGESLKASDCDDADRLTSPGHPDLCDGGRDDDCDPTTSEIGASVGGQSYFLLPDAVAAAAPGDTITVCDGGYGDPVVIDKDLTLRSVHGASATTLDVTAMGASAIEVRDASLTLEGFTVMYGEGTPDPSGSGRRLGAGLYASTSGTVRVVGCVFLENYAHDGAAMWYRATGPTSTLTLVDTVLWFNHALGDGGGLYADGPVSVEGGGIYGNEALRGGGVVVAGGSVTAMGVDMGVGADDNSPDDVWSAGGSWTGFGVGATFTCDVGGCGP